MLPCRRWLRFSLRTLLLVVTVAGCWLGYSRYHNCQKQHVWVATIIGDDQTVDTVTAELHSARIDYICAGGDTGYGLAVRRKDADRARQILRGCCPLEKGEQISIQSGDHPISECDSPDAGF
jgi:hypothetical protein